jgi:glycosyltransferase involved in cell wall biosynthesis
MKLEKPMSPNHNKIIANQKKPKRVKEQADVCLLLEGTYPYVKGGVSSWTHDIIVQQSHLTFHVLCLVPSDENLELKFELPPNVLSVTDVVLREMPNKKGAPSRNMMKQMQPELLKIINNEAGRDDFARLINIVQTSKAALSEEYLLNSEQAWEVLEEMYSSRYANSSMLDYFWSWRSVFGGVFSVLLCPLPPAKLYHTVCTGYAGLLAARAKIETGAPMLLSEHGIYTNERRVEISSADWLEETASSQLTVDVLHSDLRDLWIDAFTSYSRICYQAADKIVTLFAGNQPAQLEDGAAENKMMIIANGVDVERFAALPKVEHDVPTIAMIGRVVPIKDVKSFIRAVAIMRDQMGDLRAYIMGNAEEDPEYAIECKKLAQHLLLDDVLIFTGAVRIDEYLPQIDVVVFTSISEAQPLVILEAGAAGIPIVSTFVGACEEMIYGAYNENPPLGAGGAVVPLSNAGAVAEETMRLLTDPAYYQSCSNAIRTRVSEYYNSDLQHQQYRQLYSALIL